MGGTHGGTDTPFALLRATAFSVYYGELRWNLLRKPWTQREPSLHHRHRPCQQHSGSSGVHCRFSFLLSQPAWRDRARAESPFSSSFWVSLSLSFVAHSELFPTFCPTASKNCSSLLRGHARTKAMRVASLSFVRLERSLHGFCSCLLPLRIPGN